MFFIQDEFYKQVCGEVCELIEDNEGRSKYSWIKKYPEFEALISFEWVDVFLEYRAEF